MKIFFKRYYHWILLGLSIVAASVTAILLFGQYSDLTSSFALTSSTTTTHGDYSPSGSTNAASALDRLRKPIPWKPRDDGASPLVSRPYLLKEGKLVDPLEGNEPLYPPIPNQWLIDHQLDYADAMILDRDPKHKGFTVKEEFEAGTDPNNPDQLPPLYLKLSYSDGDIRKSSYIFHFLGQEDNEGRTEYQLRPVQPLPNPAKGNRLDPSTRALIKGETVPGAPFLKAVDYHEKVKTINDTEYDVSELVLQNTHTGESYTLIKKNSSRQYATTPIELVESVNFHYKLAGVAPQDISVERGKEFSLISLDKKHVETYKLVDLSTEGILLEKGGKTISIKPSVAPQSQPSPTPPQSSPTPTSTPTPTPVH